MVGDWTEWKAIIAPTGYGTYGIWWSHAPAMLRRGGYSGPYRTPEEAENGVRAWAEHFGVKGLVVDHRDAKLELEEREALERERVEAQAR